MVTLSMEWVGVVWGTTLYTLYILFFLLNGIKQTKTLLIVGLKFKWLKQMAISIWFLQFSNKFLNDYLGITWFMLQELLDTQTKAESKLIQLTLVAVNAVFETLPTWQCIKELLWAFNYEIWFETLCLTFRAGHRLKSND